MLVTLNIEELNEKAVPGLEALTRLLTAGEVEGHAPAPDDRRPFLVGWGLLAGLHRQACAVVLLHRKGLGHEAAANRRLMIETMAQLHWLAEDGDHAVDSMNKAFQYTHSGLRGAVDASSFEYDAEVAASADSVKEAYIPSNPANQYLAMRKLLDRLGRNLPPVWLSETQFSHPTLTGARAFFDDSKDDVVTLFDAPRYGAAADPGDASPFIAFMLLHLGMEAFNDLMVGSPWKDELDRIAAESGLAESARTSSGAGRAPGEQADGSTRSK